MPTEDMSTCRNQLLPEKTAPGQSRSDLMKNKRNKIVSKRVHRSTSTWCARAMFSIVQIDQNPCADLSDYKNSHQEQSVREACTSTEDSGRCKVSSTRLTNGCSVLIQEQSHAERFHMMSQAKMS